jgi:hypothetical protein
MLSYPCNRPWRPIGLWDVEAPTFFRQSAHRWRGQVVSLTRRPAGRPLRPGWFLVLISVRGWVDGRAVVRLVAQCLAPPRYRVPLCMHIGVEVVDETYGFTCTLWPVLTFVFQLMHQDSYATHTLDISVMLNKGKTRVASKSLWRWYGNANIMFLDNIHRPVVIQNTMFLRLEIGTGSIDWAQLIRFHLKTETESNLRNVVGFK